MLATIDILKRYRHLVIEMTKREITDRYSQQLVGAAWAWAHPILLMLLYAAVFNFIFAIRLDQLPALPRNFTTYLIAGVVPWMALQDVLGRGADAVVGHAGYVRQMAFPLEVLPVKRALSALPILLAGTAFLVVYQLVVYRSLPLTLLLWPVFLAFFVIFAIGLVFLLGALGVFLRDLREIISVFISANLYLTPIIFVPGLTPAFLEKFFWLNPFSYVIWAHQDLLFYGRIEHPASWIVFPLLAIGTLAAGIAAFQRLRLHFGDAI